MFSWLWSKKKDSEKEEPNEEVSAEKVKKNWIKITIDTNSYKRTTVRGPFNIKTKVDTIVIAESGNYLIDKDLYANLSIEAPNVILKGNRKSTIHGWIHMLHYPGSKSKLKKLIIKPPSLLHCDPCEYCFPDLQPNSNMKANCNVHKLEDLDYTDNEGDLLYSDCQIISPIPLEHDVAIHEGKATISDIGRETIEINNNADNEGTGVDFTTWKKRPFDSDNRAGLCKYDGCSNEQLNTKCCEQHSCLAERCYNIRVEGESVCEHHLTH